MNGERRGWYALASHLGLTIQEVQQKTTSSEFIEWQIVLEEEINDTDILYNYLARLTYEVARSNPNIKKQSLQRLKPEHFKIKIGRPTPKKQKIKSKTQDSKAIWLSAFGIKNPDKKKKRNR